MSALEPVRPVTVERQTVELPWWDALTKVAELAEVVARTPFVPASMRGNPAAVAACVMFGLELGLEPMTALAHVDVIDGRPAPDAELCRALAMRVGEVWVVHESATRCTVAGRRHGSEHTHEATFTMEDAKRAGLANRPNWRAYPQAMLYARASSALVRRAFPDVLGGITVTREELDGADVAPTGAAPELAPVATTRRRRTPHRVSMADAAVESERLTHANVEAMEATGVEVPEPPTADPDGSGPATVAVERDAPLPEDEDAPAPPEPDQPALPIRPPQWVGKADAEIEERDTARRKALMARFRGIGYGAEGDRQARLEITSAVIGRELASSTDMTPDEVQAMHAALDVLERNPAALTYDDDGTMRYTP